MTFISDYVRSCGTLIGLAIGDALGAPLEGLPARREWVTDMVPEGRHPRKRGEVTDDTLQALAVAESLVVCRRFDPDDIMLRLIAGYRHHPQWYGPTSSAVFDLVTTGVPPHRAARMVHDRNRGSRSNGSVMRGFPIGIFFAFADIYEMSIACSRLTHYDIVAAHSSAWLNMMTNLMCRGSSRKEAFEHARSVCDNIEVFDRLADYQRFAPEPSLDALLCTHAALFCFMNAHSYEEAVLNAINLGGDADTVGACCGALAGAYWGLEAIPKKWIADLEDYPLISSVAYELAMAAEP